MDKNTMKKAFSGSKPVWAAGLLLISLLSSCDEKVDNIEPVVAVNYAISTVSGAHPNVTTYIQGVEDLNFSSLDNSNAIELSNRGSTREYKGKVYATPFGAPATLVQYAFNNEGRPEEVQRIVVPGSNVFSTIYFQNESRAFATVSGGISKLIVFNPSTMRIEDEINLAAVTRRFPEATRTYYLDMVERDAKLFMSVYYENNFKPVNDSAYVAVIDLENTSFEKLLADGRTGMVFGGPGANPCMILDEQGDIYVKGIGTGYYDKEVPSGVLRIKKGESSFDKDYFFNLNEASGNPCYGLFYLGNDLVYTARVEDEADFFEFKTGQPQFKFFKIDLAAKTTAGAVPGLPTSYSGGMHILPYGNDELLFSTSTNEEHAVYTYDRNQQSMTKKFVSTGGHITGLRRLHPE